MAKCLAVVYKRFYLLQVFFVKNVAHGCILPIIFVKSMHKTASLPKLMKFLPDFEQLLPDFK